MPRSSQPRRAVLTGILATGAVVAGTVAALPAGAAPDPGDTAGAAGIGDPYYPKYGNGGYDVRSYDLDIDYAVRAERLTGRATIEATATQRLTRFNLDLRLRTTSVRVDGQAADFGRQGAQELIVTPASAIGDGDTFTVVVRYGGKPDKIPAPGLFDPWLSNDKAAMALGEPEVAAWWYPSNDHPLDKASFEIAVTVPDGFEAISNGTNTDTSPAPGGGRTWTWVPTEPMATYLAFLTVGQFDIERGTAEGLPYLNAYAKQLGDRFRRFAERTLRRTAAITRVEEAFFGPYPFDQVGGVVPSFGVGFALETQTRPVYSKFFFGGVNESVVAHEMAHQWYGDQVALERWRDIWLNEGFATYAQWLYEGATGGRKPQRFFLGSYEAYGENSSFWRTRIGNPGAGNEFDGAVYERGAMTLQALRNRIGAQPFAALLKQWAERAGNGSIPEFVRAAERTSGEQLGRFFDVWLFTGEKPARTRANGFPQGRDSLGPAEQRRVDAALDRMRAATAQVAAAESNKED